MKTYSVFALLFSPAAMLVTASSLRNQKNVENHGASSVLMAGRVNNAGDDPCKEEFRTYGRSCRAQCVVCTSDAQYQQSTPIYDNDCIEKCNNCASKCDSCRQHCTDQIAQKMGIGMKDFKDYSHGGGHSDCKAYCVKKPLDYLTEAKACDNTVDQSDKNKCEKLCPGNFCK